MNIPPIDLSGIVKMLRHEGTTDLYKVGTGKAGKTLKIVEEWENILNILERKLIPVLKEGGDIKGLVNPAKELAKSAGSLAAMASQVLSFVPGPIGIVCSVINSIICFSQGNIIGGFLELLGCIPGGKFATKGVAKFAPLMEKLLIKVVEKSPELAKILKQAQKTQKAIDNFLKKTVQKTSQATKKLDNNIKTNTGTIQNNPNSIMYKTAGADKQINFGQLTVGRTMTNGQLKQYRDLNYGTRNYYLNNFNTFHY